MNQGDQTPKSSPNTWDTWELISRPFLDTDDPDGLLAGNAELKHRGIHGWKLVILRIFAAGGLWWNFLWWEWAILDLRDILIGWLFNLVVILPILAGFIFGLWKGLISFAILLLLLVLFGTLVKRKPTQ